MNWETFRQLSARTFKSGDLKELVLGIASETGEVIDLYKKVTYQGNPFNRQSMVEELGDLCWYLANYCNYQEVAIQGYGIPLQRIDLLMLRLPMVYHDLRNADRPQRFVIEEFLGLVEAIGLNYGIRLPEILEYNVEKLKGRYPQ